MNTFGVLRMIKYLCFRPMTIDGESATDLTPLNFQALNKAGLKRRWKLYLEHQLVREQELNHVLEQLCEMEALSIVSVGIHVSLKSLLNKPRPYENDKISVFYILDHSEMAEIQCQRGKDELMSDILAHDNVFIPHRFPSYYDDLHELKPQLHNAKNILLESFYDRNLDDFQFGQNVYLDYRRLKDHSDPEIDLRRYFISTSYSDAINDDSLENNKGWDSFREYGLFEMIAFLREQGLTEQDILDCIHDKFLDLFKNSPRQGKVLWNL
ncbi:hypothetical protein ABIE27_003640 [Paenibacillus sp. 4624]